MQLDFYFKILLTALSFLSAGSSLVLLGLLNETRYNACFFFYANKRLKNKLFAGAHTDV